MKEQEKTSVSTPDPLSVKSALSLPQIHSRWMTILSLGPTARINAFRSLLRSLQNSELIPEVCLVPLHHCLALTYAFLGEYHLGTRAFAQALRSDSSNTFAWYGLGLSYAELGKWESAEVALSKALRCFDLDGSTSVRYDIFKPARIQAGWGVEKSAWTLTRRKVEWNWRAALDACGRRSGCLENGHQDSGGSGLHGVPAGILLGPGWDASQLTLDPLTAPVMSLHVQYASTAPSSQPAAILSQPSKLPSKSATSLAGSTINDGINSNGLESPIRYLYPVIYDDESNEENAGLPSSILAAATAIDSNARRISSETDRPNTDKPSAISSTPIHLDPGLVHDKDTITSDSKGKIRDELNHHCSSPDWMVIQITLIATPPNSPTANENHCPEQHTLSPIAKAPKPLPPLPINTLFKPLPSPERPKHHRRARTIEDMVTAWGPPSPSQNFSPFFTSSPSTTIPNSPTSPSPETQTTPKANSTSTFPADYKYNYNYNHSNHLLAHNNNHPLTKNDNESVSPPFFLDLNTNYPSPSPSPSPSLTTPKPKPTITETTPRTTSLHRREASIISLGRGKGRHIHTASTWPSTFTSPVRDYAPAIPSPLGLGLGLGPGPGTTLGLSSGSNGLEMGMETDSGLGIEINGSSEEEDPYQRDDGDGSGGYEILLPRTFEGFREVEAQTDMVRC